METEVKSAEQENKCAGPDYFSAVLSSLKKLLSCIEKKPLQASNDEQKTKRIAASLWTRICFKSFLNFIDQENADKAEELEYLGEYLGNKEILKDIVLKLKEFYNKGDPIYYYYKVYGVKLFLLEAEKEREREDGNEKLEIILIILAMHMGAPELFPVESIKNEEANNR